MRKWARRKLKDTWYKGYAAGFIDGHHNTIEFFTESVIREIHQDAVLSMTVDVDTLERIVEVIEAVRDYGKTQDD
jgi:hypothetical protein